MAVRKGMVLAAGQGTRLHPLTRVTPKVFLPVYDRPMLWYPLGVLMRAGLRDLLVVVAPEWRRQCEALLGDGSQWGVRVTIAVQEEARGLPDAIAAGAGWANGEAVAVVLGDNLIHGSLDSFHEALGRERGATMFALRSEEPERFGVVEVDREGAVVSLEEKPAAPRSNLAVVGLYVFDASVMRRAARLQPSARGESEMIDLLESYRDEGSLACREVGDDVTWLDAGTPDALLEASRFASGVRRETGRSWGCLAAIARQQGWT